jgi:hypothetical protein
MEQVTTGAERDRRGVLAAELSEDRGR